MGADEQGKCAQAGQLNLGAESRALSLVLVKPGSRAGFAVKVC